MTPPNKQKTGVQEWAPHSHNWGVGCSHSCKYCYARANALRWGTIKSPEHWYCEYIKPGRDKVKFTKKNGVIMVPTTTDITLFYLPEALRTFHGLLSAGNQLLIVSKPHMKCVSRMCEDLKPWQSQVLFRFTIGTTDNDTAKFWEPGAPSIPERMECLKYAHKHGWATSVSSEPLLGGYDTALGVLAATEPYITDAIWFGRMNYIRQRVNCTDRVVFERVREIEHLQRNSEMLRLYGELCENPMVKWKDSIAKIVERVEG